MPHQTSFCVILDKTQPRQTMPETDPSHHRPAQSRYDNTLESAEAEARALASASQLEQAHAEHAPNTRQTQHDTLLLFSAYLARVGVNRSISDLDTDPQAWRGMSKGLLLGFRTWLLEEGYAISTINQRLSIMRQYCRLVHAAGVLSDETLDLCLGVKGYSQKAGRSLDKRRRSQGFDTRKSHKKAEPTPVSQVSAQQLKTQTVSRPHSRERDHDRSLHLRDHLLMGLLIEHALRVSEIVSLNIEHFDLEALTMTIFHQKTDETRVQRLQTHTKQAAESYLAAEGRTSGPLFLGYSRKRITRFGLYHRVRLLGELVGIVPLSPHDLRHYWTVDALSNGTPIDRVQSAGNWKSPAMVLRYAKRYGIANEGVLISE
jgi:integrase